MKKLDFEAISEMFREFYKISTISHCDFLEIDNDELKLIEETLYINKDLLDKNVYDNELAELVKKMWGAFSILVWYLEPNMFRKRKVFILRVKINPKFSRVLAQLNREIRRFKNGAYADILFDVCEQE
ncbi:MAG: hypothetical protein GXO48_08730 [Chlorobi bacterium]|nr:hypothetical protein [Chlorobiota bacterium]